MLASCFKDYKTTTPIIGLNHARLSTQGLGHQTVYPQAVRRGKPEGTTLIPFMRRDQFRFAYTPTDMTI